MLLLLNRLRPADPVYIGPSTRAQRYYGVKTDAQLYLGVRGMGWL